MMLETETHLIYLLLGSNLGDSRALLQHAATQLEQQLGNINKRSAMYKTAAWGKTDQPDFVNQVLELHTRFSAMETLNIMLKIEQQMGRQRSELYAPRTIDIDLLFFNQHIIDLPNLQVPHPRIAERRFVLVPMNELAPDFKHPVWHKTIRQLLLECPDTGDVKKF